jgi:hypothetical protein
MGDHEFCKILLRVSHNRRQKYVQEKNMSLCEPRARYLNTCGYGYMSWSAAQLQQIQHLYFIATSGIYGCKPQACLYT